MFSHPSTSDLFCIKTRASVVVISCWKPQTLLSKLYNYKIVTASPQRTISFLIISTKQLNLNRG